MLETMAYSIGWTLVHSLWQGALIALCLYLCLRWTKPSAQRRYLLSSLAQLTLLVSAMVTFIWVQQSQPAAFLQIDLQPQGAALAGIAPADSSLSLSDFISPYLPWLTWLWVLGCLISMCRSLIHFMRVQDLRFRHTQVIAYDWQKKLNTLSKRLGIEQTLLLLESTKIDSPLTLGHFKPVILIPVGLLTQLPPQQIEAILAHELAHIARHDFLINLFQTLIEAFFFYHPVSWWLAYQIRDAREHCCDDIAVSLTGDKMTYARALSAVAAHQPTPQLTMAMQGQNGQLLARVKRLFGTHTPHRKLPMRALSGVLLLGAFISFAWVAPETVAKFEPQAWAETFGPEVITDFISAEVEPAPKPPVAAQPPLELPTLTRIDTPPPSVPTPPTPPVPPTPEIGEIPPLPAMPPMPAVPDVDYGAIDWEDEAQVEAFQEKMKSFEKEMDQWGQQYGKDMEKWGEEFGKKFEQDMGPQWEAYGKEMAAWGEAFGRQFEHDFEFNIQRQALRQAEQGLLQAERELRERSQDARREELETIREAQRAIREEQARLREEQRNEAERMRIERQREREFIIREEAESLAELPEIEQIFSVRDELAEQLKRDGLVEEGDTKARIKISDESMKVNGKKVSDDLHRKYLKFFERRGIEMDEEGASAYFNIKP